MLDDEYTYVKLETNRALAWAQCHPRAMVYLFLIAALNVGLNLLDLFVAG